MFMRERRVREEHEGEKSLETSMRERTVRDKHEGEKS